MEKTREPGGLPSVIGGLLDFSKACLSKTGTRHKSNPPDERKEGIANVCYILLIDSDWNIHLSPCWIVLYNFQGKTKIAAITAIMTAVNKTVV